MIASQEVFKRFSCGERYEGEAFSLRCRLQEHIEFEEELALEIFKLRNKIRRIKRRMKKKY